MRGRKPKPSALKALEGNPGRRPINTREPTALTQIPDPPAHLTVDAREEWDRVVVQLYNCRILTQLDRPTLAAYCQAYGRWVQAERTLAEMAKRDTLTGGLMIKTSNGNAIQNPIVGTANKAASDMVRYAAEFGMTPSARSRLVVNPGAYGAGKFAGILGPTRKPWEFDGDQVYERPCDEYLTRRY